MYSFTCFEFVNILKKDVRNLVFGLPNCLPIQVTFVCWIVLWHDCAQVQMPSGWKNLKTVKTFSPFFFRGIGRDGKWHPSLKDDSLSKHQPYRRYWPEIHTFNFTCFGFVNVSKKNTLRCATSGCWPAQLRLNSRRSKHLFVFLKEYGCLDLDWMVGNGSRWICLRMTHCLNFSRTDGSDLKFKRAVLRVSVSDEYILKTCVPNLAVNLSNCVQIEVTFERSHYAQIQRPHT